MDPFQDWEVRETRGFVMKHGHNKRLARRWDNLPLSMQRGRNCYSRSINDGRDVVRCGMCKPGRYRRAGGAKGLKKVGGRDSRQRDDWQHMQRDLRAILKGVAPALIEDIHSARPQRQGHQRVVFKGGDQRPQEADVSTPPPSPPAIPAARVSCACGCSRGYKGASRKHALRLGVPQKRLALTEAFAAGADELSLSKDHNVAEKANSEASGCDSDDWHLL